MTENTTNRGVPVGPLVTWPYPEFSYRALEAIRALRICDPDRLDVELKRIRAEREAERHVPNAELIWSDRETGRRGSMALEVFTPN